MDAPNALQNLAAELVHYVVDWLALDDIKSLRLVCSQLKWKAMGGQFIKSLRRQTTNLTRKSISSLEELSRHEVLGPLVQVIQVAAETPAVETAKSRLSGHEYASNRTLHLRKPNWPQLTGKQRKQAEETLAWMRTWKDDEMSESDVVEALSLILCRLGKGSLTSLELVARLVEAPGSCFTEPVASHIAMRDWQTLWVRASQLYRLTMTALLHSDIAIPNLDIYSQTLGCSVPSYDITVGLPGLKYACLGPRSAFALTEAFKLSFSTKVDHGWFGLERAYGDDVGKAERVARRRRSSDVLDKEHAEGRARVGWLSDRRAFHYKNFPGIARLLRWMPNLMTLDLHMYSTKRYNAFALHGYNDVFHRIITRHVDLPRLRRLALRGLRVSQTDLLTFVERHPNIKDLTFCNVFLVARSGTTWHRTLKEVLSRSTKTRDGPALQRLYLSDLYERPSASSSHSSRRMHREVCLLRAGERMRKDWLDRGWATICGCGDHHTLWARELSGGELVDPACFEFVGQTPCPRWTRSGDITETQANTYGEFPA